MLLPTLSELINYARFTPNIYNYLIIKEARLLSPAPAFQRSEAPVSDPRLPPLRSLPVPILGGLSPVAIKARSRQLCRGINFWDHWVIGIDLHPPSR